MLSSPLTRIQFRASYGSKLHYQRLAYESRIEWEQINKDADAELFVPCGMLRVQPSDTLAELEKETLANMVRDGLRESQFVKSDGADRQRAKEQGWDSKLLDFAIPDQPDKTYEAVLDSSAGFLRCSAACNYYRRLAESKGVVFRFGQAGEFASLITSESANGQKRATGIKTADGSSYSADAVIIAGMCFSHSFCFTHSNIRSWLVLDAAATRPGIPPRIIGRKHRHIQHRQVEQRSLGQLLA